MLPCAKGAAERSEAEGSRAGSFEFADYSIIIETVHCGNPSDAASQRRATSLCSREALDTLPFHQCLLKGRLWGVCYRSTIIKYPLISVKPGAISKRILYNTI